MPEKQSLKHEKSLLRGIMLRLREEWPQSELDALAVSAQKRLIQTNIWKEAHNIALYSAVRNELKTNLLFAAAWSSGKNTYLPVINKHEEGMMHFTQYQAADNMRSGPFGIMEPASNIVHEKGFDLMIIPGIAFNHDGHRLGFGKGYYDRFLAENPLAKGCKSIGLAYSFQLVDNLPVEPLDKKLDAICTDKELIWI